MSKSNPFKWRHYEANIILRCVRWYCTYRLSYRQLAEIVIEHDDGAALEEIDLETNPVVMAALQQLKELKQQYRYKAAWVYHKLSEQFPNVGLAELRECANLLGYKEGWAWYRWQEL